MSNFMGGGGQMLTLGGRVQCNQCQALSKRSGVQCRGPAVKGRRVCRMHGGLSTGARTPEGRQRCADARRTHGHETGEMRKERRLGSARLVVLETAGYLLGLLRGPRTRGRKPALMAEVLPELREALKIIFDRTSTPLPKEPSKIQRRGQSN
jgi:hypothetical protein